MFTLNTGKKFLLSLVFSGVTLGSFATATTPPTGNASTNATDNSQKTSYFPALTLKQQFVLALLTPIVFRFYMKEPCNEPARINWTEVKELFANPSKLFASLKENPKEVFTKLWYVMDDLIIGRAYESSSLKADKESGKIIVKNGGKPQGIIGTLHAYKKSIINTTAILLASKVLMDSAYKNGWEKLGQEDLYKLIALFAGVSVVNAN